jgi:hypothetical protein
MNMFFNDATLEERQAEEATTPIFNSARHLPQEQGCGYVGLRHENGGNLETHRPG